MDIYRPLQSTKNVREFRLLKIINSSSPFHSELNYYKIQNAPKFSALSYTWGSALKSKTKGEEDRNDNGWDREELVVDGQRVKISQNLAEGLSTVAKSNTGTTFFIWVDALCINQSDMDERATQVSMMGEIYSRAETVIVWLGRQTADSDLAISFIHELSKIKEHRSEKVLDLAQSHLYKARWIALINLLDRRWWARTWILQETILARNIIFSCGDVTIDGDAIADGFSQLYPLRIDVDDEIATQTGIGLGKSYTTLRSILGMTKLRHKRIKGQESSFLECHYSTLTSRASDPRDYIYAKLGFASDIDFVVPNYASDVADVYTQFVAGYILQENSLDIIHFQIDKTPRPDWGRSGLPSWVPDWSSPYRTFPLLDLSHREATLREPLQTNARDILSGNLSGDMKYILKCQGYIYDEIDGVSCAPRIQSVSGATLTYHQYEESQPTSSKRAYLNEAEVYQAIYKTLLAGSYSSVGRRPTSSDYSALGEKLYKLEEGFQQKSPTDLNNDFTSFDHIFFAIRSFRVHGLPLATWARVGKRYICDVEMTDSNMNYVHRVCNDTLFRRRMVITQSGYIGVASQEVQSGDLVAILDGSSLPVILRRVGCSPERYYFICAAYIYGLMKEEPTHLFRPESMAKETVYIV